MYWHLLERRVLEKGDDSMMPQMENYEKDPNILEKFGRNIVDAVKNGKIDPVIGREEEIRRMIKILSRKTKEQPRSNW